MPIAPAVNNRRCRPSSVASRQNALLMQTPFNAIGHDGPDVVEPAADLFPPAQSTLVLEHQLPDGKILLAGLLQQLVSAREGMGNRKRRLTPGRRFAFLDD